MFLKKDVHIAWLLLPMLTNEYQKTIVLAYNLREKHKIDVSMDSLRKIINKLNRASLIDSKQNNGVRAMRWKVITLVEVMEAFGFVQDISYDNKVDLIENKILKLLDEEVYRNNS